MALFSVSSQNDTHERYTEKFNQDIIFSLFTQSSVPYKEIFCVKKPMQTTEKYLLVHEICKKRDLCNVFYCINSRNVTKRAKTSYKHKSDILNVNISIITHILHLLSDKSMRKKFYIKAELSVSYCQERRLRMDLSTFSLF
ncbi:hypothetical protein ABT56_20635 [Photobacterium aquae]|uniref:Uncharacterized protein n=1 Tax=Photobacterium aquae TaxID=1195763 RepID=A0A0J1GTV5_9GAMM|nr:hypothetical protein ABT56_20635 [Photobacterium aquae]